MRASPICFSVASVLVLAACGDDRPPRARAGELLVTEIASSNPGGGRSAARDENGEYDDWIEVYNTTDHELDLAGLKLSDNRDNPSRAIIPDAKAVPLAAKSFALLFADGETFQGPTHLPFSLDKDGEPVVVSLSDGTRLTSTELPAMRSGQSWAADAAGTFVVCATPTPGAANECKDTRPPPKKIYAPYDFSDPYPPAIDAPIVISELDAYGTAGGTRTSTFAWIELYNRSGSAIDLSTISVFHTRITPPEGVPPAPGGDQVALTGSLAAGARVVIDVPGLSPDSGVVLVFGPDQTRWDALAFEELEPDTILAMPADGRGLRVSCDSASATPGEANADCIAPRERVSPPAIQRVIGSLADFDSMASPLDETTSDAASVKFVIDRENGNTVYFIDSRWLLHFDWTWEVIDKKPPFDLCDPAEKTRHLQEWGAFSTRNYFVVEARRYYLGTVIHYRDSDLWTIEFAAGDRIADAQVKETFFLVAEKMFNGTELTFRPTTSRLESVAQNIEGQLPIVATDVPFEGQVLQTLNPGVGYGILQVVSADEIETEPISYQSIVVLDRIPIDLPPVNGSITAEFQTPLSHVNVLAQNRGTPNMALKNAATDPRVTPYIGKLVRFDVTTNDFQFRVATSSEAQAFWDERIGSRPIIMPPRDLTERNLVSLEGRGFDDLPVIGAKAAQYAELVNLDWPRFVGNNIACQLSGVEPRLPVPRPAFAIPFSRYVEHLQRNGIDAEIDAFLEDDAVQQDPVMRKAALEQIRKHIEDAPVDPDLMLELTELIRDNYGVERVRFRSSTNVEDLAGFNGAGLYESHSVQLDSTVRPIDEGLKKVWSSIWTFRGYDERALFGVDQKVIAMGVLIHRGFPDEEANGVAITKNVVAPTSHGFYVNAQVGEISVVQPEGGFLPEQLLYKFYSPPEIVVLAKSSATEEGASVLTDQETHRLACVLTAVHGRFFQHYGARVPPGEFAIDAEWKLAGPERQVMIKQARPWSAGAPVEPAGCLP